MSPKRILTRASLSLAALALLAGLAPIRASAAGGPGPELSMSFAPGKGASAGAASPTRGYLPTHPDALAAAKRSAARAAAVAAAGPTLSRPLALASGPSFEGQSDNGATPPDSTGAIGPKSYVEMVNVRFGIYGRSGSLLSQGTLGQLTGLMNGCLTDPQVIWDATGQRFFYVVLDACYDRFAYGFSKTDAPTGAASWCKYVGLGYGTLLPDYPKLGDTADFVLIGVNVFAGGDFYVRSDVAWISKPSLGPIGTACPDPTGFKVGVFENVRNADGTDASTPVPANEIDTKGAGYVVSAEDATAVANASFVTVFKVTRNSTTGNARLGPPRTVDVPTFDVPPSAPQKGTTGKLDTLDTRLTQAVAAIDPGLGRVAVWTQHTVLGGAGAEVRWYEIDPGSSAVAANLRQSGAATSQSLFVFNGAISPDRAAGPAGSAYGRSMVLGVNTSSASEYSAIQMVSKTPGSPQSGLTMIKQSPGPNADFGCSPLCRWGDYAGASPDPATSLNQTSGRVWLVNQWNVASKNTNDVDWRTWVWAATP